WCPPKTGGHHAASWRNRGGVLAGRLLPSEEVQALYHAEEPKNSELIDATVVYRKSGKLPVAVGDSLPSLVATQTIEDRYYSRPVRFGGAS
ncbi:DUF3274 domain-containing protein, partial [Pseudomonas aeruginosa]|uniref:effector protein Tle3 domain-containing protein n=1 Tax=Pseudomonas aeruginosa TaxID=287 RepID=UPI003896C85B